jgi:hypothetical protein
MYLSLTWWPGGSFTCLLVVRRHGNAATNYGQPEQRGNTCSAGQHDVNRARLAAETAVRRGIGRETGVAATKFAKTHTPSELRDGDFDIDPTPRLHVTTAADDDNLRDCISKSKALAEPVSPPQSWSRRGRPSTIPRATPGTRQDRH